MQTRAILCHIKPSYLGFSEEICKTFQERPLQHHAYYAQHNPNTNLWGHHLGRVQVRSGSHGSAGLHGGCPPMDAPHLNLLTFSLLFIILSPFPRLTPKLSHYGLVMYRWGTAFPALHITAAPAPCRATQLPLMPVWIPAACCTRAQNPRALPKVFLIFHNSWAKACAKVWSGSLWPLQVYH